MNQHLVLLDFDGTIANTFADSPSGMNVGRASRLAISEVFGRNGVLAFDESGGLKNREPGELVRDILGMVRPNGLDHSQNTEWFVQAKLSRLVKQINPNWPELYPGVKELFADSRRGNIPIDLAVLSSGHDLFIKKVMEANNISMDNVILVTSDVIRQRPMPGRPRYKPHTYQMAEAHRLWLRSSGIGPVRESYGGFNNGRSYGKPNMMYVGDDPVKDGGLAREARIPFVFVPNTQPGAVVRDSATLGVSGLDQLSLLLYSERSSLRQGIPFSEIVFGYKDRELFPKPTESERPYARIVLESARKMQERR